MGRLPIDYHLPDAELVRRLERVELCELPETSRVEVQRITDGSGCRASIFAIPGTGAIHVFYHHGRLDRFFVAQWARRRLFELRRAP